VRRVRKIDLMAFLLAAVLGVGERGNRSVAAARKRFVLGSGRSVARSSFWSRFTPGFAALVSWLLERLQQVALEQSARPVGALRCFQDIIAVDATVIKVHDRLATRWPGTRRNSRPAAIKVHTRIRVLTGELLWHRITGERVHDGKAFGVNWKDAGKLFLFDRGYPSASMWWRIHRVGGFFLTRLPGSHWPKVVSENRTHRGRARRLIRRHLREASWSLTRKVIDVNCVFRAHIRAHGTRRGRYQYPHFRVVGIWNATTREYHFYVTNAPPSKLPAEVISDTYRLRWEVEIFYRSCKGGLGLGQIRSTKPHIVETQVRAALIRASVAMQARRIAVQTLPRGQWINAESWLSVWRLVLPELLRAFQRAGRAAIHWRTLAILAADPNVGRTPTRVKLTSTTGVGGWQLA
jgi:hypothetical protein